MTLQTNLTVAFILAALCVFGQGKTAEIHVNANVNLYLPRAGATKSLYPVLGYNRNTKPKILLGGVGIGASLWTALANDLNLKLHTNISKLTYWDEPVTIRNAVGLYNGSYQAGSSDYIFATGGTLHYTLANRFSIGAGLGTQILLVSLSRMPEMYGYGLPVEPSIVVNRYYKTVLPVLPLEISYKLKNLMFNIRYDLGLLNRLKGDLGKSKSDKFDLLIFELAFALKK
jgi:hypothetical protein